MPRDRYAKCFTIAFCTLIALYITAPSQADTINVPADFPTIQAGIDAAVNGDEVVVAEGIYTGDGNRNISFNGKSITVSSAEGPDTCIIDCEFAARGFNFRSGETSTAIMDGFTILNGWAVGAGGGGIRVSGASPTLRNFRIFNCSATFGGGMFLSDCRSNVTNFTITGCSALTGGGIEVSGGSTATLSNFLIEECDAAGGGGVAAFGMSNFTMNNFTIADCIANAGDGHGAGIFLSESFISAFSGEITDCDSDGFGGGIHLADGSEFDLCNSLIAFCDADVGGGFYVGPNCTANLESVDVTSCIVTRFGGGGTGDGGDVNLINCNTTLCEAGDGGGGWAFSSGADCEAINCYFGFNECGSLKEGGNGNGGAIFTFGVPATIIACTFEGNNAIRGGAIYNQQTNMQSTNCLFFENTASIWGGAVYNVSSQPQFKLATMWGNSATTAGGAFFNSGTLLNISNSILRNDSPSEIVNVGGSTTTATYSNIHGGWAGAGNINQNPMFVGQNQGDFNLSPGSPSIDAGNNAAVPVGIETDLDGNPRFVDDPKTKDTGVGDPPLVDMGALEFQILSPCPWDLDGSGSVGTSDLLTLLAQWGTPGSADFDGSGAVGTADLLILLANWGPC